MIILRILSQYNNYKNNRWFFSGSKNQLENFLDRLTFDQDLGLVVRSKGILKASDNEKWYYFDYVSGDYEIRLGEPDYTGRIVVIGSKLDTNKIEKIFENRE